MYLNLHDYARAAEAALEPSAWDYYAGGSEDERTLRANTESFAQVRLRPRVLVDVRACQTETTVLGTPLALPVLVAPTAYHGLAHAEGECATVRGAGAAGTVFVASTVATRSLEEIAAAAKGPLWFQLYVYRERAVTEAMVRRAEAAGYRALVLTVDVPVLGRRERDQRNAFGLPAHLRLANFVADHNEQLAHLHQPGVSALAVHVAIAFDAGLTWEALDWLRSITHLPILIKGILTAEDAALAVAHGAAGVIVSNHGGRQLDGAVSALEALPEVVDAVAGRCEVLLDGGVRRGTDVLKALALGARAVLIGRPALWGLAVAGSDGVADVLRLLREEFAVALALAGVPSPAEVTRGLVRLPAGW